MKRAEFEERMRLFHSGDCVRLVCRGNYGDFTVIGILRKVERGYVYLDRGFAHSYRRIKSVSSGAVKERREAEEP